MFRLKMFFDNFYQSAGVSLINDWTLSLFRVSVVFGFLNGGGNKLQVEVQTPICWQTLSGVSWSSKFKKN